MRLGALRIAGLACVAMLLAIAAYYIYLGWFFARGGVPCEHLSRLVARNGAGDAVEFAEDRCAGPAFSNVGSLSLLRRNGLRELFLEYQEGAGDPVARWLDDSHLSVTVAGVEKVYTQKQTVGATQITYDLKMASQSRD